MGATLPFLEMRFQSFPSNQSQRDTGPDGSLLVTDDGSKSIWRICYAGKPRKLAP
jgi:glucose/arabinose dehydrogenase